MNLKKGKVAPMPGDENDDAAKAVEHAKAVRGRRAPLVTRLDDIACQLKSLQAILEGVDGAGKDMEGIDGYVTSAAHLAARVGDAQLLRQLVGDPRTVKSLRTRDESGWFPIHYAACAGRRVRFQLRARSIELESFQRDAVLSQLAAFLEHLTTPAREDAAASSRDDSSSETDDDGSSCASRTEENALLESLGIPRQDEDVSPPLWVTVDDESAALSGKRGIWLEVRTTQVEPFKPVPQPRLAAADATVSIISNVCKPNAVSETTVYAAPTPDATLSRARSSLASLSATAVESFAALEIEMVQLHDCEEQTEAQAQRQLRASARESPARESPARDAC
eukprot:2104081-Pleurochrysis_carterae.AAC.2